MTLSPGPRSAALVAAGALLAGLLTGVATSASSATGAPSVARSHHRHGPDVVYRHHRVHVTHRYFGLHDASMHAYGHLPFGSLRLWDAGVAWDDVETAPNVFDWSRLDAYVSAAQAHDVQVTLVLAMTPSFYADSPTKPPTDLAMYARYVRAVMTRYRDFNGRRGIAAYQVWNEGNVANFWTGTPQQLAQMTQVVDQVRDEVDPGATVVAPSFAIRMPYQRRWMSDYQRQLVAGHPVWWNYDVNALSIYPKPQYGRRIGGPEDAMALVSMARHRLAEAGVPRHKLLWATEINYGVTSGGVATGSARHISQRRQVANVLRTYLLGAAHGLSRVFWYRYDWGRLPNGGTLGNTLLADPDNYARIRAAGIALHTAERWLRGRLVGTHGRRPCARSHHGTYQCKVRFRGGVRTIYWNPHRHVRIQLPGGSRTTTSSRASGRRVTARSVKVGYRPVMVRTRH